MWYSYTLMKTSHLTNRSFLQAWVREFVKARKGWRWVAQDAKNPLQPPSAEESGLRRARGGPWVHATKSRHSRSPASSPFGEPTPTARRKIRAASRKNGISRTGDLLHEVARRVLSEPTACITNLSVCAALACCGGRACHTFFFNLLPRLSLLCNFVYR